MIISVDAERTFVKIQHLFMRLILRYRDRKINSSNNKESPSYQTPAFYLMWNPIDIPSKIGMKAVAL